MHTLTCVKTPRSGYRIRVFLNGDYEFLSHMYGISGASGKTKKFYLYALLDNTKQENTAASTATSQKSSSKCHWQ